MENLLTLFKVASDETRLRILNALYYRDLCVCEMTGLFQESQPKVSKHLSKLKDLGLVLTTRKEKYIYYTLNRNNIALMNLVEMIQKNTLENTTLSNDTTLLTTPKLWACIGVEENTQSLEDAR